MRIKIGDNWYSSDDQPLCVQINEDEQRMISEIDRDVATAGKFAVFPDTPATTAKDRLEFMSG